MDYERVATILTILYEQLRDQEQGDAPPTAPPVPIPLEEIFAQVGVRFAAEFMLLKEDGLDLVQFQRLAQCDVGMQPFSEAVAQVLAQMILGDLPQVTEDCDAGGYCLSPVSSPRPQTSQCPGGCGQPFCIRCMVRHLEISHDCRHEAKHGPPVERVGS